MTEPANPARGEVAVEIGGVPLVVAAEMRCLAAFEALLDATHPTTVPRGMGEVLEHVAKLKFSMVEGALRCFTIRGDVDKAMAGFEVKDTVQVQQAVNAALAAKYMVKPGNAEAAGA